MKPSRNTVTKTKILSIIQNSGIALSRSEIQSVLNGSCDRITVYRVLNRLVCEGLIHKVINVDGGINYAIGNTERCDQYHIHFSCQKCQSITCMKDVKPVFQLPENYRINSVNFTVSGLCPRCC